METLKRIVVTGGACALKTTGLIRIMERLENQGWRPVLIPEVASLIFSGTGRPDFDDRADILKYQKAILETQINLENTFAKLADKPKSVILTDRGALDGKAFVTPSEWQAILDDLNLNEVGLRDRRYDAVVHMVTTADGAPEAYKIEGLRNETPAQAIEQDRRLQQAYLGHGHLKIIDNSTNLEDKLVRLETEICRILGVPEPLEIERKYLIHNHLDTLPAQCVTSLIEQTYLTSTEDERRVRKRTQNGNSVYTLGLKRFVGQGTRIEKEKFLTGSEYHGLLNTEKDAERDTIRKLRHCFIHQGRCYELDQYLDQYKGLWILEVEVENLTDPVFLPEWARDSIEVTDVPAYSNYGLARRKTHQTQPERCV